MQARYVLSKVDREAILSHALDCDLLVDGSNEGNVVDILKSWPDINNCIWGNSSKQSDIEQSYGGSMLFNETWRGGICEVLDITQLCKDAVLFYNKQREQMKVQDDQRLFIGCAWMSNNDFRAFKLLPSVIRSIQLLIPTMKSVFSLHFHAGLHLDHTSSFSMHSYRTKEWSHSAGFSVSCFFPCFLPLFSSQVEAVITDRDAQEIKEVDESISLYMPHAKHICCCWHLIEKGWQRYCPKENIVPAVHVGSFCNFCETIKKWMYTFMYAGGCESQQEYRISKAFLFAYLSSFHLDHNFSCTTSACLCNQEFCYGFPEEPFFVYEDDFVQFKCKFLRHYNECTNSSHEGTNRGMKAHSAKVLPCH